MGATLLYGFPTDYQDNHEPWITCRFLGYKQHMIKYIKTKILPAAVVSMVLIPQYTVQDPENDEKNLNFRILDHYFFIQCNRWPITERDIYPISSPLAHHTFIFVRDQDKQVKKTTVDEIKHSISRYLTTVTGNIQPNTTVTIASGPYRGWGGVVQRVDGPYATVTLTAANYSCDAKVPIIQCIPQNKLD